ncbi:ArsR/SmtB family transcription factor [Yinghuangia seranimata]|uniref:ArsR/SmtB family transcription factor n=1 Tax=Yinghuangia seranimata TaxID=408067 RepID=UPI00248B4892|nr:ArsR family transcriptional regulator [Yinghuangia seranimata]MDI2130673.1 ArsR family transcriptional regulator [Yinghuangia seranimata]
MWEVGPSMRLLRSGAAPLVHRSWLDQVRPRVAAAGLDRGLLAEIVGPTGYVPDFINPLPDGPAPTLAAELDAIRAADHRLRAMRADPASQLPKLVKEIETYWELALGPYWARIRALLEGDVFHRARQVAERGVRHVLNDLHADVSWTTGTLRVDRRPRTLARTAAGTGLLLIPATFVTQPQLRTLPDEPLQMAYTPRGVGALWEARRAPRSEAVAGVLGRARAALLAELQTPASTTDLAGRTGLTTPGASQHLTALRDAGLVSAHRAGRSVLYARTAVGEALLAAAG